MTIKQLEAAIIEEKQKAGIPDFDYTDGYVSYDEGEWLFDMQFNLPCETYFHNVSDYEEYGEGTPEYSEWLGREDNWEICGSGKFLNYPDNFVIRYRFARPSYTQVLEWMEQTFGAYINVTLDSVTVMNFKFKFDGGNIKEDFDYKFPKQSSYIQAAYIAMISLMKRISIIENIHIRHAMKK